MRALDPILAELEAEGQTTQRVLDRVPEDKLGWKPHQKSMSLGELALHVAETPGQIAQMVAAPGFDIDPANFPGPGQPKTCREILDAFKKSNATAKETLSKMDDSAAMAMWKVTMKGKDVMSMPRIAFIQSIMLNHVYHHRGQLSVYLRLLDVPVPSIYGPSADENPFG